MCRTTVIHKDELWDSADTLVWVFDAVDFRHNDLEGARTPFYTIDSYQLSYSVIQTAKARRQSAVQELGQRASELIAYEFPLTQL